MSEAARVLVEVKRGSIIEATHRGVIAAVEPDGTVVAAVGDTSLIVSARSAIKPIQAIPVVTSGAADRFNITSRELAVICASHDGEAIHTEAVAEVLEKTGSDQRALLCGAHRPYSEEAAVQLERHSMPFTSLHNNCSGKHAGMLATAVHLGLPLDNYIAVDHPVQGAIASILSRMTGLPLPLTTAVDGCSAPTFAITVLGLATAFARLVNPWSLHKPERGASSASGLAPGGSQGSSSGAPIAHHLGSDEAVAMKWIVAAMTANPEMIGGTRGRIDTDLIRVARGRLVSKVGAEAVHAVGILPCELFPRGLGLAFKIEDGARRAVAPVIIEALAQLGILDESEQAQLVRYHKPEIESHRKIKAGGIQTTFDLTAGRHG
jgi:L-asparaginase II